jgi:hypothetical protein
MPLRVAWATSSNDTAQLHWDASEPITPCISYKSLPKRHTHSRRSNGLWEAIAVAKIEWKEVLAEQVLRKLLSPYTAHHRTASKPHAPLLNRISGLQQWQLLRIFAIIPPNAFANPTDLTSAVLRLPASLSLILSAVLHDGASLDTVMKLCSNPSVGAFCTTSVFNRLLELLTQQNRFCELEGVLQAMRSSGIVADPKTFEIVAEALFCQYRLPALARFLQGLKDLSISTEQWTNRTIAIAVFCFCELGDDTAAEEMLSEIRPDDIFFTGVAEVYTSAREPTSFWRFCEMILKLGMGIPPAVISTVIHLAGDGTSALAPRIYESLVRSLARKSPHAGEACNAALQAFADRDLSSDVKAVQSLMAQWGVVVQRVTFQSLFRLVCRTQDAEFVDRLIAEWQSAREPLTPDDCCAILRVSPTPPVAQWIISVARRHWKQVPPDLGAALVLVCAAFAHSHRAWAEDTLRWCFTHLDAKGLEISAFQTLWQAACATKTMTVFLDLLVSEARGLNEAVHACEGQELNVAARKLIVWTNVHLVSDRGGWERLLQLMRPADATIKVFGKAENAEDTIAITRENSLTAATSSACFPGASVCESQLADHLPNNQIADEDGAPPADSFCSTIRDLYRQLPDPAEHFQMRHHFPLSLPRLPVLAGIDRPTPATQGLSSATTEDVIATSSDPFAPAVIKDALSDRQPVPPDTFNRCPSERVHAEMAVEENVDPSLLARRALAAARAGDLLAAQKAIEAAVEIRLCIAPTDRDELIRLYTRGDRPDLLARLLDVLPM